jgi:hypothetical protein
VVAGQRAMDEMKKDFTHWVDGIAAAEGVSATLLNEDAVPAAARAPAAGLYRRRFAAQPFVYCGPVLRHPAELMLPAVDLGGRVWLGGKPCKGGPAAPAFGG